MEFLKVEDLCKVYGRGENRVAALDHVSLSVEQGDFIAIVGSSGSGKSTLLHAIAGVDIPTSGRVLLNGQDVYAQSSEKLAVFRRRQVGLIVLLVALSAALAVRGPSRRIRRLSIVETIHAE